MKVILTAFCGKLESEPMEFPEETPPCIHLMLDQETLKFSFDDGGLIPDKIIMKRGTFEMMAHSRKLEDNTFARLFRLVDIR